MTSASEKTSFHQKGVVLKPGFNDVLLGRGGGTNNHIGNIKFRNLINKHKSQYLAASKTDKPRVAVKVVAIWKNQVPRGRFLIQEITEGNIIGSKDREVVWFEVDDHRAQLKASQCLREKAILKVLNPGTHDVLLGRGGGTNHHIGNVRFRDLIDKNKHRYVTASKKDKPTVAVQVVSAWKNQVPKGRFLTQEFTDEKYRNNDADVIWYEVDDHRAKLKTSQCLREKKERNAQSFCSEQIQQPKNRIITDDFKFTIPNGYMYQEKKEQNPRDTMPPRVSDPGTQEVYSGTVHTHTGIPWFMLEQAKDIHLRSIVHKVMPNQEKDLVRNDTKANVFPSIINSQYVPKYGISTEKKKYRECVRVPFNSQGLGFVQDCRGADSHFNVSHVLSDDEAAVKKDENTNTLTPDMMPNPLVNGGMPLEMESEKRSVLELEECQNGGIARKIFKANSFFPEAFGAREKLPLQKVDHLAQNRTEKGLNRRRSVFSKACQNQKKLYIVKLIRQPEYRDSVLL